MTFPPPNPNHRISPTTEPAADPATGSGGSSRRTAAIVALTSGLLVGGVLVGSQLVSANTPSVADDATPSTEVPATEAPSDDTTEPATEESDGGHSDWMDLGGLFDIDPEIAAQFEEFEACISEQLGDLDVFGDLEVIGEGGVIPPFDMLEDLEFPSGVFVEAGGDSGFYDFGDGDGTITITKSGDDISVSSEGDVNVQEFELPDFGVEGDFPIPEITPEQEAEIDETLENVEDACGDLLPDGLIGGLLDGVFSGDLFEIPSDD